ncbi:hypothetical protein FSARC_8690 [Fusarium sarcochroum]|uniref:Gfd2/YDR514C-like C-terminal domain-containing protein n=1 Tax=Fusarium sarcochroum TaxID=1208366 RepID=A0A8H4X634_9HYPO|nr:hypothetical protein FSARC_8690 [Fusarium sarcochroum]
MWMAKRAEKKEKERNMVPSPGPIPNWKEHDGLQREDVLENQGVEFYDHPLQASDAERFDALRLSKLFPLKASPGDRAKDLHEKIECKHYIMNEFRGHSDCNCCYPWHTTGRYNFAFGKSGYINTNDVAMYLTAALQEVRMINRTKNERDNGTLRKVCFITWDSRSEEETLARLGSLVGGKNALGWLPLSWIECHIGRTIIPIDEILAPKKSHELNKNPVPQTSAPSLISTQTPFQPDDLLTSQETTNTIIDSDDEDLLTFDEGVKSSADSVLIDFLEN